MQTEYNMNGNYLTWREFDVWIKSWLMERGLNYQKVQVGHVELNYPAMWDCNDSGDLIVEYNQSENVINILSRKKS